MKYIFKILFYAACLVAAAALMQSCRGNGTGGEEPPVPGEEEKVSRTVLVYMVATNNLGQGAAGSLNCDVSDLKEMALAADKLNGGHLLVYHASNQSAPELKELSADGTWKTVCTYPEGNESLTVQRMKKVIADTKSAAPANDYGIVFWSHASGWIEPGYTGRGSVQPRSFGSDGSSKINMSIPDMAEALADNRFSFIYFDCCHMATVEVAYELRKAAPVMVASGTELPIEGMPYDLNIPAFFEKEPNLKAAAQNTYSYYADGHSVWGPSECYISVIDLTKMDALAAAAREVMLTAPSISRYYESAPYMRSANAHFSIYDMGNYIDALSESNRLPALRKAYADAITVFHTTPKVYGLDSSRFSGMGCNIVTDAQDAMRGGYTSLAWWADVVSANPSLQ